MAINYQEKEEMRSRLMENPFSYYFDNVGEGILDVVLETIKPFGKIVLCGAVSNYDNFTNRGIHNYNNLIFKRLRLEGFTPFPYLHRLYESIKFIT